MRRRTAASRACAIVGLLLVTACTAFGPPATPPPFAGPPLAGQAPTGPVAVAILLPMTGANATAGADLLKAAQLALSPPGSPPLDIKDTGSDPQRAAAMAQAALAAGDRLILGPLTADETVAVAGVAGPANVPVLAFTSDPAAARDGAWTLGVTPAQQMRRLIAAARDDGRQHLAAILPPGAFGDALQSGLADAASLAGLEPPAVQRDDGTAAGAITALATLTHADQRRAAVADRVRALAASSDPDERRQAAELAASPPAPVDFDALLLGQNGEALHQLAGALARNDISQPQVRVLGPGTWAPQAGRLGQLAGAWFAAPDDSARAEFVHAFEAKYGQLPHPLASIAFDAAAIARVLTAGGDLSAAALTRSEGFSGVDGLLLLLPGGVVKRALAVYQITPGGGARQVSPAPADLSSLAS